MRTDVLIIGSGIGGVAAALELAGDRQRQVTLITRANRPEDSNSAQAQGGIVGRGKDDGPEQLAADVLRAGAGLCYPPAVEVLAGEGPSLLRRLLIDAAGVEFDRDPSGGFRFGLEGAHSRRRVLHVGDRTGRAVMRALLRQVEDLPNVDLLPGRTAVDLLTYPHHSEDPLAVYRPPRCHGAYVLDQQSGEISAVVAGNTVLASGGLGQIYLHTTNPEGARGDGLAMAYRAGARVVNAEYVQFHPTALDMPGTTKELISEALRGEGAVLRTPGGERFMQRYAPDKTELATRDVVARAIYREMIDQGYPHVLLDIASRRPAAEIRDRFPHIYARCMEHHIDITAQPIPVVPAAHYACGGVLVDLAGRTTLPGLYAVGEVACTGVHGANRLASTSLLEGLVWGARAARDIRDARFTRRPDEGEVPPWEATDLGTEADPALIRGDLQTIRSLMWHYVGLVRNEDRLRRSVRELQRLWQSIEEFYRSARLSDALVGLRNSVLNAVIVSRAALHNPVSRGCHHREDAAGPRGASPPSETPRLAPEEP